MLSLKEEALVIEGFFFVSTLKISLRKILIVLHLFEVEIMRAFLVQPFYSYLWERRAGSAAS